MTKLGESDNERQLRAEIDRLNGLIRELGRANSDLLMQYQNRPQEDIQNLRQEIDGLTKTDIQRLRQEIDGLTKTIEQRNAEVNGLNAKIDRLSNLRRSLVEDLHETDKVILRIRYRRPLWLQAEHKPDDRLGFVLMPYRAALEPVYDTIERVLKTNGCHCLTAKDMTRQDIMAAIWQGISAARIVIADLTGPNPNVAYEIGIADHLGKDLILLSQTDCPRKIPFDFRGQRLVVYSPSDLKCLLDNLDKRVKDILTRREET